MASAANSLASFQHDHMEATLGQEMRSIRSRETGSDNYDALHVGSLTAVRI
jgi:hypothetical protein